MLFEESNDELLADSWAVDYLYWITDPANLPFPCIGWVPSDFDDEPREGPWNEKDRALAKKDFLAFFANWRAIRHDSC